VAIFSRLEIIPRDYRMQSLENGINCKQMIGCYSYTSINEYPLVCGKCHQLFIHDYITLCPPKEVLEYLVKYVKETPAEEQMPLYQVHTRPSSCYKLTLGWEQVFRELATHNLQGLPDPSAILPYIGLYTIVYLKPEELRDVTISTSFFPPVYILSNGLWQMAPNQTVLTGPTVAHIFDPLTVNTSRQHPSPGLIPLHSDQAQFARKQYWRLQNASLEGILSAVVFRAILNPSHTDELELAKDLHCILTHRRPLGVDAVPSGEGGEGRSGGKGEQGTPKPAG
jgi:hypothetical protein